MDLPTYLKCSQPKDLFKHRNNWSIAFSTVSTDILQISDAWKNQAPLLLYPPRMKGPANISSKFCEWNTIHSDELPFNQHISPRLAFAIIMQCYTTPSIKLSHLHLFAHPHPPSTTPQTSFHHSPNFLYLPTYIKKSRNHQKCPLLNLLSSKFSFLTTTNPYSRTSRPPRSRLCV